MEDEINLADVIKVLSKYKKLIISLVIITLIFAFIYSKISPKQYQATATILPIEGGTGSLISSAFGIFGGAGGGGSNKIIAVLNSRTLAKGVMNNLNLFQDKQGGDLESAASALAGSVSAKNTKEGLLAITAVWNEPEMAAKIANAYVDELGNFINNRSLGITFQSVDSALPPPTYFKPQTKKNLLQAGGGALVVGIMLAFLIEYFRTSIWKQTS